MGWQDSFQADEGIPSAASTGQVSAQDAGARTVAPIPENPLKYVPPSSFVPDDASVAPQPAAPVSRADMSNPNFGQPAPAAAAPTPATPANEEPSVMPQAVAPMSRAEMYSDPIAAANNPTSVERRSKEADAAYQQKLATIADTLKKASGDENATFDEKKGLDRFGTRAKMALLANNTNERDRILQEAIPGVKTLQLQVPGVGPMLVYKAPGDDAYHSIKGTDWNAGDLGDMTGAAPQVAAQVAASMAMEGEPFLARASGLGLAGAGTELAQREGSRVAGVNQEPASADAGSAAKAGGLAAGAEGLASVFSRLAGGASKGTLVLSPEEKAAVDAEKALGAPNLTLGGLKGGMFGTRENYLAKVTPQLKDQYDKQAQFLSDTLKPANGQPVAPIGDTDLSSILSGATQKAEGDLANPNVTPTAAGRTVQDAFNTGFRQQAPARTSGKYDAAWNAADGLNFDPTALKDSAEGLENGVQARGYPETEAAAPGSPTSTTATETTVPVGQQPAGIIPGLIDTIKKINPSMEAVNGAAPAAQLQALRTRLAAAAAQYPADGSPAAKAEWAQARDLLDTLDNKVLANPTGEGASDFSAKLSAARNSAAFQNKVFDSPVIQDVMNAKEPGDLLKYMEPGNFTQKKLLARTIGPDAYKTMQDAYMTRLATDPEGIPAALAKSAKGGFEDPAELNLALRPDQQQRLVQYSGAMNDIKNSLPQKLLDVAPEDRAKEAFKLADGSQLRDLMTNVPGGMYGLMGTQLRQGVKQAILEASQDTAQKGMQVSPKKLFLNLNKFLGDSVDGGSLKGVLSPQEISQLQQVRTYAQKAGPTGNMGAALAAGEKGQEAFELLKPLHMLAAWADARVLGGVQSRSFTTNLGRNVYLGGPTSTGAAALIHHGAAAAAPALNDRLNAEPSMAP